MDARELTAAITQLKAAEPNHDKCQRQIDTVLQKAVNDSLQGGPQTITQLQHTFASMHHQKVIDHMQYSRLLDALNVAMQAAAHIPLRVRAPRYPGNFERICGAHMHFCALTQNAWLAANFYAFSLQL